MGVVQRLTEFIDFKGISINQFSKEIHVSNSYFSKQKASDGSIGSKIIQEIVKKYEDLNVEWLLTGKGSMLRDAQPTTPSSLPTTPSSLRDLPAISPCPELLAQVAELKATIADLKQDKAHLRDIIKHQQEQISFFLQHNKELEEVLSDYKEVIEDYQKKATQKG